MFTRRNQLWLYIFLSALTALCQYVIQGAMASGHNPASFANWFWYLDFSLWGARSLIEAGVIVYLFSTNAQTRKQGIILTIFEIALISLITPTVGFALRGLGYGLETRQMLAEPWLTWWYMGIGAYTSLMMGAAGYAYRVQPEDNVVNDEVAGLQSELADLREHTQYTQRELDQAQGELRAAREAVTSVSAFAALTPQQQVLWIAGKRNGDGLPTNQDLAKIYDVHPATIGRWIADGKKGE